MKLDNFRYPRLERMTSRDIKAYHKLIDFSIAVRSYNINPTLPMNINKVKESYQSYIPEKGKIKISKDWENFEKELINQVKGLIGSKNA